MKPSTYTELVLRVVHERALGISEHDFKLVLHAAGKSGDDFLDDCRQVASVLCRGAINELVQDTEILQILRQNAAKRRVLARP